MLNDAVPVPEAGETRSHGAVETAVQVTVPAPVCVSRTICAEVRAPSSVPVVTALMVSAVRSSAMSGRVVVTSAWRHSSSPFRRYW